MLQSRRRLGVIAIVCVLTITLLLALSGPSGPSESSDAAVVPAATGEPQRLSQPEGLADLNQWEGLEAAVAAYQAEQTRIWYEAAAEATRQRREAAAAAERERERREAAAAAKAAASQPAQTQTYSGGSVWDRLAQCESHGNWATNTGNGYYGGLQFNLPTWQAYGGTGYPHEHSRAEQIRVAENLRAARGYQPWPECSKKLGLR